MELDMCNIKLERYKVYYVDVTDEMKTNIKNLVSSAYYKYSDNGERSKYISNEMKNKYNQHSWSCLISNDYGYYIWHINNMAYTYRYNNLDFTIFIGCYWKN